LGRLQHIVGVLVRHGLGDGVRRMGWADALEELGPAFLKPAFGLLGFLGALAGALWLLRSIGRSGQRD
jgi:hypothetical protein